MRKLSILALPFLCVLFGACSSGPSTTPHLGSAIINVKPDPAFRKGIGQPKLVSVNGKRAKGTQSVIRQGRNQVTTQFRWPNGQAQEVNLSFEAKPGSVYHLYYDLFPLEGKFTGKISGSMVEAIGNARDPYAVILGTVFMAPAAAVIGVGEKINHNANHISRTHLDLMLVAQGSSEGIVRQVRVYPSGQAAPTEPVAGFPSRF